MVCDARAPSRDAEMSVIAFSELPFVQCLSVCRTQKELLGHEQAPAVVSHSAAHAEPRGMLNKGLLRALPVFYVLSYLCILLQA